MLLALLLLSIKKKFKEDSFPLPMMLAIGTVTPTTPARPRQWDVQFLGLNTALLVLMPATFTFVVTASLYLCTPNPGRIRYFSTSMSSLSLAMTHNLLETSNG
jgi:hypothetical protein